jgi:hypothetical protein
VGLTTGKGVDGSSPSEGSAKAPEIGAFSLALVCTSSSMQWVWSRLWSFQIQNTPFPGCGCGFDRPHWVRERGMGRGL